MAQVTQEKLDMSARIRIFLSIIGLISLLAACAPAPAVNPVTEPHSTAVGVITPTAQAALAPRPISVSLAAMFEIPLEVSSCRPLRKYRWVHWADNYGWLVNETPGWYGVICEQGHVIELQLYYNQLNGSLPPEMGKLTHLKSFYLDDNQLRGPVPAEIGNLAGLQTVRFGRNQFSSLPAELADLKNLVFLELWGNQLSGKIPSWLGNISHLQMLNLHSNQFSGEIPPELGSLAFLHDLNLSHNQLSGSIPAALGDLKNLNQLDLSFNQLSGSIPSELEQLTNLYLLDLSYNQLTGAVPAGIAQGPMSEGRLWGNLFDGILLASQEPITTVDAQGVHLEFNSHLFKSVWPEIVPAFPPSVGGWLGNQAGACRFTFAYPEASDELKPLERRFWSPRILIFPAQEYSTMSEFAQEEIAGLQTLLATRPSAPENEMPLLPLINAAQIFHTQLEYLDFQNGMGVRFITHYSQDIGPIMNHNIFYTFQGLTDDGEYYVAVYFPISAAGLNNEPPVGDWQTFNERYQDYLKETVSHLDALSANDFEPDLEILDAVINHSQRLHILCFAANNWANKSLIRFLLSTQLDSANQSDQDQDQPNN
jgi:hypothetical protein